MLCFAGCPVDDDEARSRTDYECFGDDEVSEIYGSDTDTDTDSDTSMDISEIMDSESFRDTEFSE